MDYCLEVMFKKQVDPDKARDIFLEWRRERSQKRLKVFPAAVKVKTSDSKLTLSGSSAMQPGDVDEACASLRQYLLDHI